MDYVNGRHPVNSFLDVLTAGFFGKLFSEVAVAWYFKMMVEKRSGDKMPSIIGFKTSEPKQTGLL